MRPEKRDSGRNELSGEVRGRVRSALLGWTDPVTGDRLRVSVKGESGLVDSLEPLGFERIVDEEDSAPPSAFEGKDEGRRATSFFHARLERERRSADRDEARPDEESKAAG